MIDEVFKNRHKCPACGSMNTLVSEAHNFSADPKANGYKLVCLDCNKRLLVRMVDGKEVIMEDDGI